jgi:Erv1 / Alr family
MSKNVWGPATWHLMHCMVLKIDDNINSSQLEDLKRMISRIISNLPCPYCTDHATSFLKANHFAGVKTISALRYFMFYFHNKVNERLKKPQMGYEEHIQLYVNMNLKIVVDHFFRIYKDMNQTSVTMMLRSYHRQIILKELNQYFMQTQELYRLY